MSHETASFPVRALDALLLLANASGASESVHALSVARAQLGPYAELCAPLLASMARRAQELDHLERLVSCDALTGVANRRAFAQALDHELARQQRSREPFALILLDLDDLKQRNDLHGHAAGDAALVALARACERVVRGTDLVARLGGDEFAVLLPGADHAGARELAARLRQAVEREHAGAGPLRVSIGVAATDEGVGQARALTALADQRLYRDKAARKRPFRTKAA